MATLTFAVGAPAPPPTGIVTYPPQPPVLGAAVVPGQPVEIYWQVWGLQQADFDGGDQLSAQLLINGNLVWKDAIPVPVIQAVGIVVSNPVLGGPPVWGWGPIPGVFEASESQVITPGSSTADQFYKIGTNTLQLIVTGSGAGTETGPWVAEAELTVVGENIDDSWWSWNSFISPAWNTPYVVLGTITNRSKYSSETFKVDIIETALTTGQTTDRGGVGSQKVAIGGSAVVPSTSITQNWTFNQLGTWILTGPFSEQFNYNATYQVLTDDFNNGYPPYTEKTTLVTVVTVPPLKQAAAVSAFALMVGAAVLLAEAAIYWFIWPAYAQALAKGAVATATAANAAGTASRDPLPPDEHFLTAVSVPHHVLAGGQTDLEEFGPVKTWIDAATNVLDNFSALSAAEAKIAGAKLAGNQPALVMQLSNYLQLVSQVSVRYAEFAKAVQSVGSGPKKAPDPKKVRNLLLKWHKRGLSASDRKILTEAGVPKKLVATLELGLKDDKFTITATTAPSLSTISSSLLSLVRETGRRAIEVLSQASAP